MIEKYFAIDDCYVKSGYNLIGLRKGEVIFRKNKSWYKKCKYISETEFVVMRQNSSTFYRLLDTGKLIPYTEGAEILYE